MAFFAGLPKPPRYPSGRYTRTNPLRREAGLRILAGPLPEPLRWALIRAWRRPSSSASAMQPAPELPSPHRQRPDDATLLRKPPSIVGYLTLVELELSQRVVEAPQASIRPATRDAMLFAQGMYLRRLYDALAFQVGGAAALAEFEHLLAAVA